jgi:hypothetical protein
VENSYPEKIHDLKVIVLIRRRFTFDEHMLPGTILMKFTMGQSFENGEAEDDK